KRRSGHLWMFGAVHGVSPSPEFPSHTCITSGAVVTPHPNYFRQHLVALMPAVVLLPTIRVLALVRLRLGLLSFVLGSGCCLLQLPYFRLDLVNHADVLVIPRRLRLGLVIHLANALGREVHVPQIRRPHT